MIWYALHTIYHTLDIIYLYSTPQILSLCIYVTVYICIYVFLHHTRLLMSAWSSRSLAPSHSGGGQHRLRGRRADLGEDEAGGHEAPGASKSGIPKDRVDGIGSYYGIWCIYIYIHMYIYVYIYMCYPPPPKIYQNQCHQRYSWLLSSPQFRS